MKIHRSGRMLLCTALLSLIYLVAGNAQDHTSWTYNRALYEVNIRQFTKQGTIAALHPHLDRLQDLGAGILWFMPVHPIGVKNRLGSLGSYYSVKDYYGVNPEFGTAQEFRTLVDSIHAKGMYVMIDWVANHTSWDNVLTVSHPEWYAKGNGGVFVPPPGTNWSDVIQLDYSNQELRAYMIDAMKYWVTEMKVDGFRYDAASFLPIGFWSQVSAALKAVKPDIFLLAEDQGTQYSGAGMHMTFGWSFYGFGGGILPKLVKGTAGANDLAAYFDNEYLYYPGNIYRLYFTSNHDENSWYGTDTELFGAAADAFIALSMTVRSMPLLYGGQEAALDHRLKFFDKDEIIWKNVARTGRIASLLRLKKSNSALWNGNKGSEPVRVATTADQNVYAFLRQNGKDKVLAYFNCSGTEKDFVTIGSTVSGMYRDIFSDSLTLLTPNYRMVLPAWGYKIMEGYSLSDVEDRITPSPDGFVLLQNFPNPFNPSTTIRYFLPADASVRISVFDQLGRIVDDLGNVNGSAGWNEIPWKTAASTGVYHCTIFVTQTSGKTVTRNLRMMLLR